MLLVLHCVCLTRRAWCWRVRAFLTRLWLLFTTLNIEAYPSGAADHRDHAQQQGHSPEEVERIHHDPSRSLRQYAGSEVIRSNPFTDLGFVRLQFEYAIYFCVSRR